MSTFVSLNRRLRYISWPLLSIHPTRPRLPTGLFFFFLLALYVSLSRCCNHTITSSSASSHPSIQKTENATVPLSITHTPTPYPHPKHTLLPAPLAKVPSTNPESLAAPVVYVFLRAISSRTHPPRGVLERPLTQHRNNQGYYIYIYATLPRLQSRKLPTSPSYSIFLYILFGAHESLILFSLAPLSPNLSPGVPFTFSHRLARTALVSFLSQL